MIADSAVGPVLAVAGGLFPADHVDFAEGLVFSVLVVSFPVDGRGSDVGGDGLVGPASGLQGLREVIVCDGFAVPVAGLLADREIFPVSCNGLIELACLLQCQAVERRSVR